VLDIATQLPQQARGPPGRSISEPLTLQDNDFRAAAGELHRGAQPGNAAANDYDIARVIACHAFNLLGPRNGSQVARRKSTGKLRGEAPFPQKTLGPEPFSFANPWLMIRRAIRCFVRRQPIGPFCLSFKPAVWWEPPLNPRYERWRRRTFGITWLIYASFYLTRQSFAVAKVALPFDTSVSLTRNDLGVIDSTFLTVYMIGQFVFGPLGDRFGPRRILLFGLGLSVIAAVGFGLSTTLTAFLLWSVLQGIAQSTGWSNTTKTMSSWFSINERGRVIGWWCTHYTFGAAIALPFAGWAMDYFGHARFTASVLPAVFFVGPALPCFPMASLAPVMLFSTVAPFWPAAFWAPALVVAIVLVLAWLLLRNGPEDIGLPPIEEYHGDPMPLQASDALIVESPAGSWQTIGAVLTTPRIWTLALAYFSVKLVRYAFYFWGPKFVAETMHSDAFASTVVAAAMPVGGLVGVIAGGYLSDKLFQARRAPVTVLSLLAAAAVMSVGLTSIHNVWVLAAFFFFVGVFLFGPDSMISATASIDFGTKRGAGTAVGIVNGIGSIGGILGGWLPGRITSGSDWTPLFGVMLVGLIVSAVVLLPLWNVKPSTD
jgi:OPA family glycerol-3-phosphate transporter-like MFS transporter